MKKDDPFRKTFRSRGPNIVLLDFLQHRAPWLRDTAKGSTRPPAPGSEKILPCLREEGPSCRFDIVRAKTDRVPAHAAAAPLPSQKRPRPASEPLDLPGPCELGRT